MKLTNNNINLKKFFVPSVWMVIVFILIVAWEVYVLYTQVYRQLSPDFTGDETENLVRLDLDSYNKSLIILDNAKNFVPDKVNPVTTNPFK